MVELVYGREQMKSAENSVGITLTAYSAALCQMSRKRLLPRSRIISVPQVSQLLCWDCGLACLLMVLRAVGNFSQTLCSLHELCPSKSVWTVDLAHLFRKFELKVRFTTLTLGTNPGFSEELFYGRMHEDEIRVEHLFQAAAAAGIDMQQRSVALLELQHLLLAGRHLVIALVDKATLEQGLALWSDSLLGNESEIGYKGHYVVLCGYNSESDSFILRDPDPRSAAMGLCSITSSVLERARRAFGTDEDLLFIELPFLQGTISDC